MAKRPEHLAPPEIFYNADEARKYTSNSRMIQIQSELTQRCIELLNLPEGQPSFILDVGCGSGLSGEELTDAGHHWVGLDISKDMLDVAREREVEGDLVLQDMGAGMPFRPGTFDGVISVSALQWLCNADHGSHRPRKRLLHFFTTLYGAMVHGGRAVFQFYPENPEQMQLVTEQAMKAGFTGGLVVDFPNSAKAKKIFLCLFAGVFRALPAARTGEEHGDDGQHAAFSRAHKARGSHGKRVPLKKREWVLAKKDRMRRQLGEESVRPDSKYTARKRRAFVK